MHCIQTSNRPIIPYAWQQRQQCLRICRWDLPVNPSCLLAQEPFCSLATACRSSSMCSRNKPWHARKWDTFSITIQTYPNQNGPIQFFDGSFLNHLELETEFLFVTCTSFQITSGSIVKVHLFLSSFISASFTPIESSRLQSLNWASLLLHAPLFCHGAPSVPRSAGGVSFKPKRVGSSPWSEPFRACFSRSSFSKSWTRWCRDASSLASNVHPIFGYAFCGSKSYGNCLINMASLNMTASQNQGHDVSTCFILKHSKIA